MVKRESGYGKLPWTPFVYLEVAVPVAVSVGRVFPNPRRTRDKPLFGVLTHFLYRGTFHAIFATHGYLWVGIASVREVGCLLAKLARLFWKSVYSAQVFPPVE